MMNNIDANLIKNGTIGNWVVANVPDTNVGKLISREAAIASAISGMVRTIQTSEGDENWIRVKEVRESLMGLPSIDVVPVVRCKDCKHRDAENGFCEGRGWPMQLVPDDGFCDKGERREDGET